MGSVTVGAVVEERRGEAADETVAMDLDHVHAHFPGIPGSSSELFHNGVCLLRGEGIGVGHHIFCQQTVYFITGDLAALTVEAADVVHIIFRVEQLNRYLAVIPVADLHDLAEVIGILQRTQRGSTQHGRDYRNIRQDNQRSAAFGNLLIEVQAFPAHRSGSKDDGVFQGKGADLNRLEQFIHE